MSKDEVVDLCKWKHSSSLEAALLTERQKNLALLKELETLRKEHSKVLSLKTKKGKKRAD